MVNKFREALVLNNNSNSGQLLTLALTEADDDKNDPILTLERLAEAESIKSLMKNIKHKGKDKINQAMLMVPKTKHLQRKMLEKRILKSEIEGKFKESNAEVVDDEWDKILKTFNPTSKEWKPIFPNTTGKTRMLLKQAVRQYSTSTF